MLAAFVPITLAQVKHPFSRIKGVEIRATIGRAIEAVGLPPELEPPARVESQGAVVFYGGLATGDLISTEVALPLTPPRKVTWEAAPFHGTEHTLGRGAWATPALSGLVAADRALWRKRSPRAARCLRWAVGIVEATIIFCNVAQLPWSPSFLTGGSRPKP